MIAAESEHGDEGTDVETQPPDRDVGCHVLLRSWPVAGRRLLAFMIIHAGLIDLAAAVEPPGVTINLDRLKRLRAARMPTFDEPILFDTSKRTRSAEAP